MKRINPRRAKKHRAYTVNEMAELHGVHKHTVRNWLKKGVPAIDGAKPTLAPFVSKYAIKSDI